VGEPQRLRHPDEWAAFAGADAGCVQLQRTFHAPSNLDETEVLCVMLTGVFGRGEVGLNGVVLGQFADDQTACEFPVPLPLPFSNSLTIHISYTAATADHPDVGVHGVVVLEIRANR